MQSLLFAAAALALLLCVCPQDIVAFSPARPIRKQSLFQHNMMDPTMASVLAGSVAGVVGSGVSLPLDTIKTRAQLLAPTKTKQSHGKLIAVGAYSGQQVPWQNNTMTTTVFAPQPPLTQETVDLLQLTMDIYKTEGWQGFFSGSRAVLLGTGLHKAIAFTTNASILAQLQSHGMESSFALILAASIAGIVGSLVLCPFDRIKIALQATGSSVYSSELDCLMSVVHQDGWVGLMGRGLGPTMLREVPSECIYFGLYGFLMSNCVAAAGPFAPLICGAMSGMASWLPVFPLDTVKTIAQNDSSEASSSSWDIALRVYQDRGLEGFFDGISPRMLRSAVAHAITFSCYDLIMSSL